MWKTIKYSKMKKPLIDINEQGVVYSYRTKQLKSLKQKNRETCPYYYWSDGNGTHYVHIEVAKAFPEICGEWFKGCDVHHKDGNPLNNDATNLIVCTKEEHFKMHQEMKKKKAKNEYLLKNSFDNILERCKKEGKNTVCYYCRKSKKNKDGLSPIEVSVTLNYIRRFKATGFFCKPEDFEQGIYPEGFNEYREHFFV